MTPIISAQWMLAWKNKMVQSDNTVFMIGIVAATVIIITGHGTRGQSPVTAPKRMVLCGWWTAPFKALKVSLSRLQTWSLDLIHPKVLLPPFSYWIPIRSSHFFGCYESIDSASNWNSYCFHVSYDTVTKYCIWRLGIYGWHMKMFRLITSLCDKIVIVLGVSKMYTA